LLGQQHATHPALEKLGVRAVNLTAKTTSNQIFQDIAAGKYQLVIASPEYVGQDPRFRKYLWSTQSKFRDLVTRIIFDEAHCVMNWGDFRPAYHRLCFLPPMLPNATFLALSATLTPLMVSELKRLLGIYDVEVIRRSNDRHNITPIVRRMNYSVKSLHDLDFLIPLGLTPTSAPPPKFMLFMESKKLCQRAGRFLRSRLPPELQDHVVWVHADMTSGFNEDAMAKLKNGELFGVVCTDVAGMGIDIPDIDLVVQYQLPKKYCILFQRIGRAARGQGRTANVIIIVEPKYLDDTTISVRKPMATSQGKKRALDEDRSSQIPHPKRCRTTGPSSTSLHKPQSTTLDTPLTSIPKPQNPKDNGDIEPVMDAFINAAIRQSGCRRRAGNQG
ncbi:hypothetical protein FRC10_002264, partial [Ceratobasidium sp. 414]